MNPVANKLLELLKAYKYCMTLLVSVVFQANICQFQLEEITKESG